MSRGRKVVSGFLAVGIVAVLCAGANAGVILNGVSWYDPGVLDPQGSTWSWDSGSLELVLDESYVASGPHWVAAGAQGQADEDPIIHIVKTVTNNSTFVWTDYHIVITGSQGVSYVPGSATSDVFGTKQEAGNVIDFFAPQSVGIGQSVTFTLDVVVPAGLFTFNISQTPTPEPTSLLLLGLGGTVIAWRRRRC